MLFQVNMHQATMGLAEEGSESDLKPVQGMPLSSPCPQKFQLLLQAPQAAPIRNPVWQGLL